MTGTDPAETELSGISDKLPATSEDIVSRARAALDGITPGEWEADGAEVSQHWSCPEPWAKVVSTDVACMSYCYGGSAQGVESEVDAQFIAAAPDLVRDLADKLEKAQAWAAWFAAERDDWAHVAEVTLTHTLKDWQESQAVAAWFAAERDHLASMRDADLLVADTEVERLTAERDEARAAVDRVRKLAGAAILGGGPCGSTSCGEALADELVATIDGED